ncbi:MAG: helix-turn-helix domain-containing protein [Candidatus Stygibacter australis]|nr:helix-turn-helix domain-containing protein [Candidatus Stygibacter australis]
MNEKTYSTVKEAMVMLHVSKRTIYQYCQDGTLEYTKPAGIIYILNESILNFLKSGIPKKGKTPVIKSTGTISKGDQTENCET